eukprot:3117243-Rhodomonas_salina.4
MPVPYANTVPLSALHRSEALDCLTVSCYNSTMHDRVLALYVVLPICYAVTGTDLERTALRSVLEASRAESGMGEEKAGNGLRYAMSGTGVGVGDASDCSLCAPRGRSALLAAYELPTRCPVLNTAYGDIRVPYAMSSTNIHTNVRHFATRLPVLTDNSLVVWGYSTDFVHDAMSDADIAARDGAVRYPPTRVLCDVRTSHSVRRRVLSAYAPAMLCPALTWHNVHSGFAGAFLGCVGLARWDCVVPSRLATLSADATRLCYTPRLYASYAITRYHPPPRPSCGIALCYEPTPCSYDFRYAPKSPARNHLFTTTGTTRVASGKLRDDVDVDVALIVDAGPDPRP